MLNFRDPETAWELVQEAIDLRREITDAARPRDRRYAGSNFRADWQDTDAHAGEAHEFEWTSNIVPHLIYTNPSFNTRIPGAPADMPIAREARMGLNAWSKATDIADALTELAYDLQFSFGVGTVLLERIPGGSESGTPADADEPAMGGPALRPVMHRIPPSYFFVDPRGGSFRRARFMGHVWIEDADRLKAQKDAKGKPVYDAAVIDGLTDVDVSLALHELDDPLLGSLGERGEVVGVTVYCRDTGYLHTLAYGTGVELRKPRRYNGPRSGPYVLFGCWTVRDQIYPLAPLAVTDRVVEEINAHSQKISQDAATAARIVVVDSGNGQLSKILAPGNHGTVWDIPGVSPQSIATIEFGGPDVKNMEFVEGLRAKLDRTSGLSETVRGNISSGATAEEVATAQQNRNVRVKFMQAMFKRSVAACARIALHHLLYNPDVGVDGEDVDQDTGETTYYTAMGEPRQGDEANAAERMLIEIEPYSMEMVDEVLMQRTMEVAMQDVVANAPVMVQAPFIRWRNAIDDRFESLNIQGGAERYIDFDMLLIAQQMTNPQLFMQAGTLPPEMAMQMGLMPPAPGQMPPPGGGPPVPAGKPPSDGPKTNAQASAGVRRGMMAQGR